MTGHYVKVTWPGEQSWPTMYLESITIASTWSPAPPASIDWLRTRAHELKCQVAIIRVTRAWCWTPIKSCCSAMPSVCPWGCIEKSVTHQKMYASLTYKVLLSAVYIEHILYGPEDMANRQPLNCQSTIINMNDQPVPNLQDIRGWSIWIN